VIAPRSGPMFERLHEGAMTQPERVIPPIDDVLPRPRLSAELIAARRAELVRAATELFIRQGFHKTTIRQVADAAGWTMGSLYEYISTKDDILFLISYSIGERLHQAVVRGDGVHPGSAVAELVDALDRMFDVVGELRQHLNFIYRESASWLPHHSNALQQFELSIRDYFAAILERGVGEHVFRPSINARFSAHTVIMLVHMWALKSWALRGEVGWDEFRVYQRDAVLRQVMTVPPEA
jgi:TetR/AcrR family transcriptional regulator, cholesterol catabolism regulator